MKDMSHYIHHLEQPYTRPTYVIINIWHSNSPRLAHSLFFRKCKRKLRDYGHVSLETYELINDFGEPKAGDLVEYKITYMSLWQGVSSDSFTFTPNLEEPFRFATHSEDIQSLHRSADISVRLERLDVPALNEHFRCIYQDIEDNPELYKHSILHAFGLAQLWHNKTYCCSTFIKELLYVGGISRNFRYWDISESERFYRGLRQGFATASLGALSGWLVGTGFFLHKHYLSDATLPTQTTELVMQSMSNSMYDEINEEELGAAAAEIPNNLIINFSTLVISCLSIWFWKNKIYLDKNDYFVTAATSITMGGLSGAMVGLCAGLVGIDSSFFHSPSYIADLALSAQKVEEIERLCEGDTSTEQLSSKFLRLMGYR